MKTIHSRASVRQAWRRITCVAALLLVCTPVFAQELIIQAEEPPPLQMIPMDAAPDVQFAEPQQHVSSADTGMWFLSTYCCPQSFDRSCPRFNPTVARYDDCVGYRNSSYQEMCAALEPGVPVCIMIHGSFVDCPSACREAVCTWNWIRSASIGHRMQMIYFNWPSYKPLNVLTAIDATILGRRAARNGYYLAELLQHLPPECPVCLIGHSHGTRVAAAGLHLLAGGDIQRVRHPYARVNGQQIRTVFCASAMDHDWLNPRQKYDRALCSTQCLLNMQNCHDPALALYPLRLPLLTRPALGLTGLTRTDRRRLGPYGSKVRDINVTRTVGASHLWPYYFTKPGLAMAMRNYVYFPDQMSHSTMPVAAAEHKVIR